MKKTIPKSLTALFFMFLYGMMLVSCGPIFDIGDTVNGNGNGDNPNPPPPGPPPDGYEVVRAYDASDLADYLGSEDTSFAITLTEIESKDIYLTKNISIVKPMKIIGAAGSVYTIHTINKAGGNAFYCLDLQANLELHYCGFTGYGGTTGASSGIPAGSPPITISEGRTLTMGRDSVLELRGIGSGVETRTGSQVKLGDGATISDNSTGDLLFRAGVEKLSVSGKASVKNKLTLGEGAAIQIERGGELRVGSGATLILDNDIEELKLDGDIVIDRTGSSLGSLVFADGLTIDSLLAKITGGNGTLNIENGAPGEMDPFQQGANTILKLGSNRISLEKWSSDIGGVVRLTRDFTLIKDTKLAVGAGIELDLKDKTLTIEGGTLDVTGNVTTSNGQLIISAEDKFIGTPKGSVTIGSYGIVTVDNGGVFKDESVSRNASNFTFPSYGTGSLLIKNGGQGIFGTEEVIGANGLLKLDDANSTIAIKTSSGVSEFTLRGKGTLDITSGLALEGTIIIEGGAELRITGGNTLTVKAPNALIGFSTTQLAAPKIIVDAGNKVDFYPAGANAGVNSSLLSDSTYTWEGSDWHRFRP